MPYTPPSQQSPASSKSSSPAVSRSSSYHQDDIPRSPSASRPQPPRSHSSASYLHKHRRSPSLTKGDGGPPTPTHALDSHAIAATDFAQRGSIRQSPPPITNLKIPSGAVISPPDSSENSDGDEGNTERGRELEKNWDQLQLAVRSIPQQRDGSPNKDDAESKHQTSSVPTSQVTSPTALSAEQRKISHSRSSTETKITLRTPTFVESPVQTTDSSDDDENSMAKPALIRKKSGELVKPALRPSSRRRYSSMPGTPTYSKSVHFNDSNNQTRHFLQVDKPTAVSAGSSPVETYDSESEFPFGEDDKQPELEIKISEFPQDTYERKLMPVRLERLFLSGDKTTLVGVCAVQNLAFQKQVNARFTLDYWKTTSEVSAEYNNDPRSRPDDGCDRFNFHIKVTDQANIDNKTLLLCVRYSVGNQEYWDNNNNTNYQVDFTRGERKQTRQVKPVKPVSTLGQRPLNAIPRSRHTSASPRGKHESLDDDFAVRFDNNSSFSFSSSDKLLGDSPASSIRLKTKPKRSSPFPSQQSAGANGLGSRYDFGTSLSAALSVAHDKLGRHSGLTGTNAVEKLPAGSYFGPVERTGPAKVDARDERPDAIVDDYRPAIGSDQYKDLVQKFCYFTPGSGKVPTSPLPAMSRSMQALSQDLQRKSQPRGDTDGSYEPDSNSTSTWSSGANSPVPQVDGIHERAPQAAAIGSHFASRSTSPAPVTGQNYGARSASPVSFGYPYHSHRDGYLSDTPTPTAIHG